MDTLLKILLITHVSAGFTSLGLFFVPAFAKKGSKLHNNFGRWYTYGMWAVIITALLLCVIRYFQGEQVIALFLGFLALLTSRPLYFGIAVLRNKEGPSARMNRINTVLSTALLLLSPLLLFTGLGWVGDGGHPLLIVFGALGCAITIPDFIAKLRGREKTYYWLHEHISGMGVSAIAAFTAFFAFGGSRIFGNLFTGSLEIAAWIAPTVIGVAFIRYYKYRMKRPETV